MAISNKRKSVQAYVLNATKDEIVKRAKQTGLSESKIAGKILDEAVVIEPYLEPLPRGYFNTPTDKMKKG